MNKQRATADLVAADKRHVWHPFTQMQDWESGSPLVIERAEGCYLFDSDGNRYFDGVSSLWVNVHGHNHPTINDAIVAQLGKVAHTTLLGLASPPSIELAEKLVALAPPGLTRVFYSDSGSTAVEIALKQAFQYWQLVGEHKKTKFVHLAESYHGDTLGAVAVGGISLFHEVYGPILIEAIPAPTPHPYRDPARRSPGAVCDAALRALDALFAERAHEIGAMIVEPLMQGAGGMIAHPAGFLAGVAERCRRHGILLIVDEVATGFGRTGKMFACEHEDVTPDFLCVAKGITGGYLPLAATLSTEEVYRAFLGPRISGRTFFHGHTYTGNALACAAALANLELFQSTAVIRELPNKIKYLSDCLALRIGPLTAVGEIRQVGMMVGIELVADRETRAAFPAAEFVGTKVCEAARAHGLLIRPLGDVIVLMPPLVSTEAQLSSMVDAVVAGIAEICT